MLRKDEVITYDEGKGRDVYCGRIVGDTFVKLIHYGVHIMHKFAQASCIQECELPTLEKAGVKWVRVNVCGGNDYRAPLSAYCSMQAMSFDEGHGRQVGLPIEEFEIITRRIG
jgi:hypothetical protein